MSKDLGIRFLYIIGAVLALPSVLYVVTFFIRELTSVIKDHTALIALRWVIADIILYALVLGGYWLVRGRERETFLDVIRKPKDYYHVSDMILTIATIGAVIVFSISLLVFILNL